jgi:hypothetical protein
VREVLAGQSLVPDPPAMIMQQSNINLLYQIPSGK